MSSVGPAAGVIAPGDDAGVRRCGGPIDALSGRWTIVDALDVIAPYVLVASVGLRRYLSGGSGASDSQARSAFSHVC